MVFSFVKAQVKELAKELVSRIIRTAELIDNGLSKASVGNGRLKTIKTNYAHHDSEQTSTGDLWARHLNSPGTPSQPPPNQSFRSLSHHSSPPSHAPARALPTQGQFYSQSRLQFPAKLPRDGYHIMDDENKTGKIPPSDIYGFFLFFSFSFVHDAGPASTVGRLAPEPYTILL